MIEPTRLPPVPTFFDRTVGWMLLMSGLALLGLSALTPLWLEHRQLRWQRDVMQQQTVRLAEQAQRYRQFREALEHEEPLLLARLAYQQLRLKPAGSMAISAHAAMLPHHPGASHAAFVSDDHPPPLTARRPLADGSVEAWLHLPMPKVGVDLIPPPPVESLLVRLVSGAGHVVMIALGLVCLSSGLLLGHGRGMTNDEARMTNQ